MGKNIVPRQLDSAKLFFDSDEDSTELTFSEMCKFVRHSFRTTQATIAKKLGVNLSAYRYWEAGEREPSGKPALNLFFLYVQCLSWEQEAPGAKRVKLLTDYLSNENASDQNTRAA